MLCISQPTKPSSMLWAATKQERITLLLPVSWRHRSVQHNAPPLWLTLLLATSGAAATIASDAFMNPFDGRSFIFVPTVAVLLILGSHQAAHADPKLQQDVQVDDGLRALCLSKRGPVCLLRLLPDNPVHDSAIYRFTIPGIRIDIYQHEPRQAVRSLDALHGRCCRWRFRSCSDDTHGCYQDHVANTRVGG